MWPFFPSRYGDRLASRAARAHVWQEHSLVPEPPGAIRMTWFPIVLATIAGVAGVRYLIRLRAAHSAEAPPTVDDAAIRQILERGTLSTGPEALDLGEIARAE